MPFLNFYHLRPALKLLIILLATVTIGIIVFFTGLLLGRVIFWMHLDEVNNLLFGRYELLTTWQLKYFQLIQTLGFFVLPGLFLYWIFSKPDHEYFPIGKRPGILSVTLLIIVFIAGMPFLNWIIEINREIEFPYFMRGFEHKLQELENTYNSLSERLLLADNFVHYLFNLLMIAVLPAIGEELIFRGTFQQLFKEISKSNHMAVLITAFLFSAIHGQFYGFIPRLILGMFFGYLMVWSKTIWLPIIAHFFNNAVAVTVYYLISTNRISDSSKIMNMGEGIILVIFSIVLTTLGLFFMRNTLVKSKNNVSKE